MKQFTFTAVQDTEESEHEFGNKDLMRYEAESRLEAYYVFLEECLGIKLSEYQKESVMRNLQYNENNIIFGLVQVNEVLP